MKRVKIAFAVVLVGLVGVIGWHVWQEHEPVYKGRTLTSWLKEECEQRSAPRGMGHIYRYDPEPLEAVQHIGSNAVPTLLSLLQVKDTPFKTNVMGLLARQHFIKVDFKPAEFWHAAADRGFEIIRTNAKAAAPGLFEIAIKNISSSSQKYAVTSLRLIHPPAEQMALYRPYLLQWATNADGDVRACARDALCQVDPKALTGLLLDEAATTNLHARARVVLQLGYFGPPMKAAVPYLLQCATNRYYELRIVAKQSLLSIDPEAAAKAGITNIQP